MSMEQPLIIGIQGSTVFYPDQYPTAVDCIKQTSSFISETNRVIAILNKDDKDLLMADLLINDMPTSIIHHFTIDQFSIFTRASTDVTLLLVSREYMDREKDEANSIRVVRANRKGAVYVFKNKLTELVSDAIYTV